MQLRADTTDTTAKAASHTICMLLLLLQASSPANRQPLLVAHRMLAKTLPTQDWANCQCNLTSARFVSRVLYLICHLASKGASYYTWCSTGPVPVPVAVAVEAVATNETTVQVELLLHAQIRSRATALIHSPPRHFGYQLSFDPTRVSVDLSEFFNALFLIPFAFSCHSLSVSVFQASVRFAWVCLLILPCV